MIPFILAVLLSVLALPAESRTLQDSNIPQIFAHRGQSFNYNSLRICAFNIRVFGVAKMEKEHVVDILERVRHTYSYKGRLSMIYHVTKGQRSKILLQMVRDKYVANRVTKGYVTAIVSKRYVTYIVALVSLQRERHSYYDDKRVRHGYV